MRSLIPAQVSQGLGQDDRVLAAASKAGKIINFRWNPEGWWDNDRGWEPLVPYPEDYAYPADSLAPVRGLWVWSRNEGAEVYYLFERNGSLQIEYGNDNGGSVFARVELATGRHVPGPGEPGTQFVPNGRWALLLNGYDAPLKYWGREYLTAFGFQSRPPPPHVVGVEPQALGTGINDSTGEGIAIGETSLGGVEPLLLSPSGFLGTSTGLNTYVYRVSWVSDTGAESPLSEDALVAWENDPLDNALAIGTQAVWLSSLPSGPSNIVAWRIYRTKNLGEQNELEDRQFYFVAEVPYLSRGSYVDTTPDSRLITLAPEFSASVALPPGLRYAAVYDGRTWVGGGANAPQRVWYSERGLPEQFAAFNYIDLGSSECGSITQLCPYQGQLFVIRERGVDVIEPLEDGTYHQANVDPSTGTVASDTVKPVPGFGVLFLGRGGVYSVGRNGLMHVSGDLAEEWRRAASGALARATAAYSPVEGEYWVQYPADGASENLRGAVLHASISTAENQVWSLRNITPESGDSVYKTVVTRLAADQDGWFILGTAPVNLTNGDYPGMAEFADLAESDELDGVGLQVWSAAPFAGKRLTVTAIGETFETTSEEVAKVQSLFQSAWLEFDPRGLVHKIEVWLINTGRPSITCEVAVNGREEWTDVSQSVEVAPPETAKSSDNDHVYADDATAERFGYQSTWGTSKWREDRVVRVRWDVSLSARSVTSFAFRLRTRDHLGVVAYRVGANPIGVMGQSQIGRTGGT